MKKRVISLVLSVCIILSTLNGVIISVSAADYTTGADGDFVYANYGSYCTILEYTGTDRNVVIPSEIESLPVTGVEQSAFYNNDYIQSVVFPSGVTKLGVNACFL